jgi:mRNA-degrading endonuclease toxin of MazEF toxin-antitoxin module
VSGVVALRGEIWEVNLNPRKGREQKGIRPCLIVSTDAMNRSRFGTVIVCPRSTRGSVACSCRKVDGQGHPR